MGCYYRSDTHISIYQRNRTKTIIQVSGICGQFIATLERRLHGENISLEANRGTGGGLAIAFAVFYSRLQADVERDWKKGLTSSPSPEFFYKLSKEILNFLQCHIFSSNLLAHSVDCAPPNDKT